MGPVIPPDRGESGLPAPAAGDEATHQLALWPTPESRLSSQVASRSVRVRFLVLLTITPLLVLVLRAPDAIVLPEPAQDLWPIPRFVLPAVDITLAETEEMDGWTPVPLVVTAEEVRTDVWLWRRLFFHNWDRFATPLREEGLTAMLSRFRRPLLGPVAWDHMDAGDWDRVPQPVRAMAVFGMTDCWHGHYRPGRAFGLDARSVRDRLHAIAMAESWFEHRAVQENDDGTRDLGITQASDYARNRIRVLHIRGKSDFGLAEDDYFDPWKATRALVYWFSLMLEETAGDLDAATRAYHVGGDRALAGRGGDYLDNITRVEREYVGGSAPSPTWTWLRERCPSPCPLLQEPEALHDPDEDDGAADRHHPTAGGAVGDEAEGAEDPAAEGRPDDADDDVGEDPHLGARLHHEAGEPAHDPTDHEGHDQAHHQHLPGRLRAERPRV